MFHITKMNKMKDVCLNTINLPLQFLFAEVKFHDRAVNLNPIHLCVSAVHTTETLYKLQLLLLTAFSILTEIIALHSFTYLLATFFTSLLVFFTF